MIFFPTPKEILPKVTSNIKPQLHLTSLRNYDVTHSRIVTYFRILKKQKKYSFLILHKLGLL